MRGQDHPNLLHAHSRWPIPLLRRGLDWASRLAAGTIIVGLTGVLMGSPMATGEELPVGRSIAGPSDSRSPEMASSHHQDPQTSTSAAEPPQKSGANSDDVSGVLSLLGISPERRQLAAELEALLRQGQLEAAEDRLNTAIEVGSIAILLTGRLRDPNLLAGLQALGGQAEERPIIPPMVTDGPRALPRDGADKALAPPPSMDLTELTEAKEREQQRAEAVAHELAAVREELRAFQEREANSVAESTKQIAALKSALERERERADAATKDLVALAEERRTLQALREQDSALLATNRTELNELKAGLEEMQRDASGSVASPKSEQPLKERAADPKVTGLTAGRALAPAPSSIAAITPKEAAVVPVSPGGLRGVPEVLNTATLSLQGQLIRLFGVETAGDIDSATELSQYLGGREVLCNPAGLTNIYRCQVDGKDLSLVVLFNGGGRVTSDATSELKIAADRARAAGIGVWSKSLSSN